MNLLQIDITLCYPVQELLDSDDDEEEEQKPKKQPPKYVASGGLTGFGVAQDLLHIDFSPPEEAPEEFKAQPFNAKRITTLKSGLSGMLYSINRALQST
jgi:hypothetical protein